ncbi:MAG: DNA primase [Candidatus Marinimicrobia bacterium]|nr:DNA primase [Candidatus Neomarinimicrobiota bacterium]
MAKIPEFTIEKIKDANDIVDVVASYLPMKKKGANYWARCPFHDEKTASFSVSPSKQIYHCFGCGVGGNVLNFVMEYEKLSFIEAIKQLAERANIPLEYEDVSPQEQSDTGKLREIHVQAIDLYYQELFKPSGKVALDYLLSRGLSEETIRAFKLGYAPESWDFLVSKLSDQYTPELLMKSGLVVRSEKDGRLFDRFRGRVMFPVFDDRANAIGFGGRLMKDDKNDAKYLNSPETLIYNKRKILYGLHVTRDNIRKEKKAIVVEGYMDFLQLYQHGYINVVAGSGTAFTDEHARLLRRFADEVILCYDSDIAGQKAAVKTGFGVSSQKLECKVLVLPDGEDPDSYLRKEGAEGFFKKEAAALPFIEFLRQYYQPSKMSAKIKSDTITQLLEEIRTFSDPVYREMFAREISKLFFVDEQTLLQQLNRQNRPRNRGEKNIFMGEKPKHFKNQGEAAEYFLLQLLVNGVTTVRKAGLRYLSPVLYKHPFLKQVLEEVLKVLDKNILITARQLPDKISDDRVKSFTYKLFMEEQNLKNQEQIFVESLKQIEMQMLKDEYNDLTEKLRSAEAEEIPDIIKKQMDNMKARKQLDSQYTMDIFQEIEV